MLFVSLRSSKNPPSSRVNPTVIPTPTIFQTSFIPKDPLKEQTISDENFSSWVSSVRKTYPWYKNLPLQSSEYFVYFDLEKKVFIAKLYPSKSSTVSIDEQIKIIKEHVLVSLATMGINVNLYQLEWIVNPE